jgi:isopentenyl-diphosphate delta-isomerase
MLHNLPYSDNHTAQQTISRKRDHVELCIGQNVAFRRKTSGFERVEFIHNALPELNFDEISLQTSFLGKTVSLPIMISCMTGGYAEAEDINRALAEVCEQLRLPMGVGSQRQALESSLHHVSFRAARLAAPTIPLVGNIGAAEVAMPHLRPAFRRLVELIDADALTVHLNPLQELLQPEGTPCFRGVLEGIEELVRTLGVPIIVKEVGAGISADVARRLLDVGVRIIDVAGAGGTSWAGVEILRHSQQDNLHTTDEFWDWGIPTVECLLSIRPLKDAQKNAQKQVKPLTLVASGGVSSGVDVAKAIALGADMTGIARIALQTLTQMNSAATNASGGNRKKKNEGTPRYRITSSDQGQQALERMLRQWERDMRSVMFLTGASTLSALQRVPVRVAER